jgi:hypothetical protein
VNCNTSVLNQGQRSNYETLKQKMVTILTSAPACPGDGNGDGIVNALDIADYHRIAHDRGRSSHYDFNFDGFTNETDREIIQDHIGSCPNPN